MRTITNRLAITLAPARQKMADDLLTGMAAGNVYVFRASPGMGKTTIRRWMQAKLGSPGRTSVPAKPFCERDSARFPARFRPPLWRCWPATAKTFRERISKPLWRKQNCCMRTPWRTAPNRRRGAVLSPCHRNVAGKPAKPGKRREPPFGKKIMAFRPAETVLRPLLVPGLPHEPARVSRAASFPPRA